MMKMKTRTTLVALLIIGAAAPFTLANHHGGEAAKQKDIVDVLTTPAPTFETLAAAVTAAGLTDTLKSEGPFTVFAPTDEAFAALPEGTVENLLKPENRDKLTAILTHHVVAGKIMAADVAPGEVETVNGSKITISNKDGKVMIGGAKLIAKDQEGSNGVIHVIDAVLLP